MAATTAEKGSRRATPSPPVQQQHDATSVSLSSTKQRRGTDPAKFKTSICRNWETTGTCTFRGCTFAHGNDELRPAKSPSPNAAPATPPVQPSQMTPPLAASQHPPLPRSLASSSATAHAHPPHHSASTATAPIPRSEQGNTNNNKARQQHLVGSSISDGIATPNSGPMSTSSFTVSTPPVHAAASPALHHHHLHHHQHHQTSPIQTSSLAPPPPPPSYAAAMQQQQQQNVAGAMLYAATPHRSSGLGSSPNPGTSNGGGGASLASAEHIADAILAEVAHCRELMSIHADANASLERAVAAERNARRELAERMRQLKAEAATLKQELDRRRAASATSGKPLPTLHSAAAQPPLNAGAAAFVPSFAPASIASLGGSIGSPDAAATPTTNPSASVPVFLKLAPSLAPSGSASTSDVASDAVASPTDPGQQDRLRRILESLHLDQE